jgi:hypothetical protein
MILCIDISTLHGLKHGNRNGLHGWESYIELLTKTAYKTERTHYVLMQVQS